MKDFKNFARYIGERQIKLYGSNPRNKIDRLVNGIISGKYDSDKEAAWDLYRSGPTNKSYQMLKSRIKDQMITYPFLVDYKKFIPDYGQKFHLANKYMAAGQQMISLGLSTDGEDLVKEGLAIAMSYQFSGLILFGGRLLYSRASFKGTHHEFIKYSNIIKKNLKFYEAELEADELYNELKMDIRKTFAPVNKQKATKYWKRVNYLTKKYKSHYMKIMRGFIGAYYFEAIGNYRGVLKICDEIEAYLLKDTKFYDIPKHRLFSMNKIEACLVLKEYALGEKNAEICMKLFNKYSINSLIAMEYYVLLCIHAKKYEKAWKLFDEATSSVLFRDYPPERYDKWKIFEAYLNFIHPKPGSKFKVNKFLNEVPVYSKDKRGINIAIIIAQIILLVDDGNFETLLDKTDAFKAYFRRYVNKSINYRTYYFIKMILVMFDNTFNYRKTEEGSKPFFNRLGDKEGHYKGDIESLEIIPYENLWPEVLNRLKKHEFSFQEPVERYSKKSRKVS